MLFLRSILRGWGLGETTYTFLGDTIQQLRALNRYLIKKDKQMRNKHMKRCSYHISLEEYKLK